MSIFDKLKVSAGIGNAKVDARLMTDKVRQGETVTGEVYIAGGAAEQEIQAAIISVMTRVTVEHDDKKFMQDAEIQRVRIGEAFTIGAGEEKTIEFSFTLSPETPMTVGKKDVWLKTTLDVPFAIDPKDKDYLEVQGSKAAETVLRAVSQLGFTVKKAENLKSRRTKSGVIQEIEFYPGGDFRRDFSELELAFLPDASGVTVYIELDHRAKGLGGLLAQALDMDESRHSIRLQNSTIGSTEDTARQLRNVLKQLAR